MITLKEYAKKHGISYEAVRKQVNRYREDLGEHLYKVERTQYIDEDGEAFLDQKRASNPVVVIEHDKDEQIEELKKQNEALRAKVVQLQDIIISRDAKVMELQDRLLLLTTKPDQELDSPRQQESVEKEEKELEGSEEMLDEKPGRSDGQSDKDELSVVQPLEEPVKKKKWWQFWK